MNKPIYRTDNKEYMVRQYQGRKKIYFNYKGAYFVLNGQHIYLDNVLCTTFPRTVYTPDNCILTTLGAYYAVSYSFYWYVEIIDGEYVQLWEELMSNEI